MKAMLLAGAAGLFWGIGEVFTKVVLHSGKIGPVTAIAVRSTVALPVLWLVWLLVARSGAEPAGWTRAGTPTLARLTLGSGLLAGAGGMICFYLALHAGEITKVKPVAFTVAPATAVLLGWLVLGEAMTAQKALGVALVLAGVLVLTTSR
ncbi:MAG: EamA family transporter [Planctomycetes bacterium]|nr:EamA family transporter [Planctomycetota bacterium]